MMEAFYTIYSDVPISALNASCRMRLSQMLNGDVPVASAAGYPRNWEGLAELIGFRFNRIRLMKKKLDPTTNLIDEWEGDMNATVGKLIEYLVIIERYDVQRDIQDFIERDGERYLREQEQERLRLEARNPVQDPQVSSGDPINCDVTVRDVLVPRLETDEPTSYNAYVSYADTDIDFVFELIRRLEGEHSLSLFIKERDMLPGLLESEAQIKMMHERCERILLVLSPEFLNDPKCEFQTVIAQAMQVETNMYSRKVIPIIYKQCELPVRLRYIANLNYTRQDMFGSFWTRLYSSITRPNQMNSNGNTGTFRLTAQSLPTRGHASSIQLSPSMSSLMDIDPIAPSARQLNVAPGGSSSCINVTNNLTPSLTYDSGIGSSSRSVSMSDCQTPSPTATSASETLNSRDKKTTQKTKKISTGNRVKEFFTSFGGGSSSGHSGHISN